MKSILKWSAIGFGVLIALSIVIAIVGGGSDDESESDSESQVQEVAKASAEPTAAPTPQPTSTPQPSPTPEPTPEPVLFEGAGDGLSQPFEVREGLALLTLSHDGSSNFIVQFVSDSGDSELTVNTIGDYSGRRAHRVEEGQLLGLTPGTHRLEVNADGNWAIEFSQPRWQGGQTPPFDRSDKGDNVIGPITLPSGVTAASFTHTGSSNFIVQLLSVDGRRSDFVINEIGQYEGTVAIKAQQGALIGLEPGVHAVVVRADGAWTAKFEE